jgi:integrase
MYLEVGANGQKGWRLKYRIHGIEKRISLGVYPEVRLRDARESREDARRLIAKGVDPSQERKRQKIIAATAAANSFEAIAREFHDRQSAAWVPAHAERKLNRLQRDIFPQIGARPIGSITPPELLQMIRRIEARGVRETAKRALVDCGQIFRYAIATGRAVRDSAADIRGALAPSKTEHFAATTDPQKVGELLRAFDGYKGSTTVRCALRLMPLVFVRPGELRRAMWRDVNLETAEWRFTVSKTNTPHVVPLSNQAVEILREMQQVPASGLFIFPSARSSNDPMSDNAILAAMREMGIEKHVMTGHGFRAVARTLLDEELHFRPDLIEHQLAHAVRDPNGRAYNRTAFLAERKKMMQCWADYLDGLKNNRAGRRTGD